MLAWNEFFRNLRFYYPVAVLYFQSVSGSYAAGMSVFSVMALASALFEIPTGILSDRLGRKMTMVAVALAELAAIGCFAAAQGLGLLLLGGMLYGLAQALFSGTAEALLYESMAFYRKKHRYADTLGRVSSMTQGALALASVIAALLLGAGATMRLLVALSLGSVFIGLLTALFMHEPPAAKKRQDSASGHFREAAAKVWRNRDLRWISFASILHYGVGGATNNFMPGFVASVWPLWATGLLRFIQNSLGSISYWFAGATVRRFGALKVLCAGTFAMNAIHIPALLMANVFSPILMSVTQIFYAANTVSRSAFLQSHFSSSERATMGSIVSFGTAVAQAVFAVLIGLLADHVGPALAMLSAMLIRLPVPVIIWNLMRPPADTATGKG